MTEQLRRALARYKKHFIIGFTKPVDRDAVARLASLDHLSDEEFAVRLDSARRACKTVFGRGCEDFLIAQVMIAEVETVEVERLVGVAPELEPKVEPPKKEEPAPTKPGKRLASWMEVNKVPDLSFLADYTEKDLLDSDGIGPAVLKEIKVLLKAKGLSLKE